MRRVLLLSLALILCGCEVAIAGIGSMQTGEVRLVLSNTNAMADWQGKESSSTIYGVGTDCSLGMARGSRLDF